MPRTLTNLTGATTNDKVAALPSLYMSKMGQTVSDVKLSFRSTTT
jgi:hypothetical protein